MNESSMPDCAVLFIIFNRPDTTQRVFEAIRLARPSRLYIAADAPRKNHISDVEKCTDTRDIVKNIDWTCEVHTLFRDENLGCGLAVSEAINWFFSENDEGIILEDDCLPHPDFFTFASAMLEKFRDNKKIISINGSNLGYKSANNDSYTFSRFMNMWGWATWKDSASEIDYEMGEWKKINSPLFWLYRKLRQGAFDFDLNWFRLWKFKFDKVSMDQNFTWDWQWLFQQFSRKQLTVVPAFNLISNIGFNDDATHTVGADNPAANIATKAMPLPLQHPAEIKPDFVYEEENVKWVWCYHKRLPAIFYIKQFISKLIKQ